jgi:chromate transporter
MTAKLVLLVLIFGRLSLLAVGGVNSTIPEIEHQVVEVHHWLTAAQFPQLYAISQSAPGPNLLISTVIGAHVAGIPGGIVATLAMMLPAGILVIVVSQLWDRFREHRWRRVLQTALLPISAGLVLAAGAILARTADRSALLAGITLVTAFLIFRTRLHPLWVLAGGAILGLVFG